VADAFANLLLILLGSLTPECALGHHSLHQGAEEAYEMSLVLARELAAQPAGAGRLLNAEFLAFVAKSQSEP
jgi:hypothetical protein